MKINTKTVLKTLSGEDMVDERGNKFTLGKALGNILAASEDQGKMKLVTLGMQLFQEKDMELDTADFALIKETVKKSKFYSALIAGQCELLLEEVKEEK